MTAPPTIMQGGRLDAGSYVYCVRNIQQDLNSLSSVINCHRAIVTVARLNGSHTIDWCSKQLGGAESPTTAAGVSPI